MSRKRKSISLRVQLAAALCQIGCIPYAHARAMTPEQVRSLFALDHFPIPHTFGGTDDHWNLEFRFVKSHREKTRRMDTPAIKKVRRAEKRRAAEELEKSSARERVHAADISPGRVQKTAKRKQVMAGSKASNWKRKLNGKTEKRDDRPTA